VVFLQLNTTNPCAGTKKQPESNKIVVLISAQFCSFAV